MWENDWGILLLKLYWRKKWKKGSSSSKPRANCVGVTYINSILLITFYLGPTPWIGYASLDLSLPLRSMAFSPTPFPWWATNQNRETSLDGPPTWTCPNHLKGASLCLSPINASPKCSPMCVCVFFFIWEHLLVALIDDKLKETR